MRKVTKKQALTLLETAVNYQGLLNRLYGALGTTDIGVLELAEHLGAIFDKDFKDMEDSEFDYYWDAFYDTLKLEITTSEKALIIFEKINTNLAESNSQVAEDGVVSYNFQGTLKKVA